MVVGYAADQVCDYLREEPDVLFATQSEQLGTGHAARVCQPLLSDYRGPALILVGDEPLLRPQPLGDLLDRQRNDRVSCLLGTVNLPDPTGFGRILRDSAGRFIRIVEERDCTPEERKLSEVNPSCYVFELPDLWDALDRIGTSNSQGEYYLTDAPEHLIAMGAVLALNVLQPDDVLGVNSRQQLAQAAAIMQSRIHDRWMSEGVTIVDPRTTYIDGRCTIGRDTVIYPSTVIDGVVQIGSNCRIGPLTHLRDGTILDDDVEVGAFVEIKQSHLGRGTIVRHLAYLGNAEVGESVNFGATAITANFDGVQKFQTVIGDRSRVGAGAILIAPVNVGQDSIVGANAVVTKNSDVADGQTVVGIPARPLE